MAYVLHHLLTESAARCPDAEAVRLLNDAITYRELETRSNQLAHGLIKSGVVPGDRIGITSEITGSYRQYIWSSQNGRLLCSGRCKRARTAPAGNCAAMRVPHIDYELHAIRETSHHTKGGVAHVGHLLCG